MQEKPQAQSKSATTSRADQPTNVAGLMAQVEADFWKMRAQMLIYHQEKVAALEADYRAAVQPVLAAGLPTTICTIYNGALERADVAMPARVALML